MIIGLYKINGLQERHNNNEKDNPKNNNNCGHERILSII